MKQETKKLIEWIKECIEFTVDDYNTKDNIENKSKAYTFLDSLPEIESHLKTGGYIPDMTNRPCCDGDKVVFNVFFEGGDCEEKEGILSWDKIYNKFEIKTKTSNGKDIFITFENVCNVRKVVC